MCLRSTRPFPHDVTHLECTYSIVHSARLLSASTQKSSDALIVTCSVDNVLPMSINLCHP